MNPGRDEALASIFHDLAQRGLAAPAAILLDAHRPLLPILRLAGIFLAPFAGPLLGSWRLGRLIAAAADPAAYDRLTKRLATHRTAPSTAPSTAPTTGPGEQEA